MKTLHICLFLSIIFLLSFTLRVTNNTNDNIIIVLDAGHGGKDQGAYVDGVFEADLNLSITLKLKDILTNYGIEVILTRSGNYDLSEGASNRKKADAKARVRLTNESNASLFISIHMNKFPEAKYKGAQTFFSPNLSINRLFAYSIQYELVESTKTTRKAKEIRNIFIIDNIRVPGVLVEAGFMSNPEELTLLQTSEHQQIIAKSIFNGISNYIQLL